MKNQKKIMNINFDWIEIEEFTSSNSGLILFNRNLNKYGYMIW
jgi:hypothetical protein